ncbi:MAG: hypothetical protein FWD79_05035 [Desulfobulbus sp.]|nr:hypothetical protein [Desulfobulbus sp.]
MDTREHFDTILLACCDRMQEEIAALLGKPFTLGEPEFRHTGKKELFAGLAKKEILIHAGLEGEVEGSGCVLVGIDDAIRLGGTLIMLPEPELERILFAQDYLEELQDANKEIAKVICGASAAVLAEQFPQKLRLVSGEQEIVVPAEVEIGSDQPIPDIPYYLMTASIQLNGRGLGPLRLVLPAIPLLGLEHSGSPDSALAAVAVQPAGLSRDDVSADATGMTPASPAVLPGESDVFQRSPDGQGPSALASRERATRRQEVVRRKALVDHLLQSGMAKMGEELRVLFTGVLKVVFEGNRAVTREAFLDQIGERQMMTRMAIKGDSQGEAYLLVEDKTAIYLGGTLIMRPEVDLEEMIRNGAMDDDIHDAYGEVADIVSAVYSTLFEEQQHGAFGLVKKSTELIVPARINLDANNIFPDHTYYLAAGQIRYDGRDLGRLQFLIPAGLFTLEDLPLLDGTPGDGVEDEDEGQVAAPAGELAPAAGAGGAEQADLAAASAGEPASAAPGRLREQPERNPDILLFTDDDGEADRIAELLETMGYFCRVLHFKEPVHSVMHPNIRIVFLVMREASELGFGVAIKISSAGLSVPLVVASPAWTRTLVLKAVRYGACDILITPASPEDIREKIAAVNMVGNTV